MTSRIVDRNGYIEIPDNPLTRVGVFPYSGAQLGLTGPDATRVFQVYRPAETLSNPDVIKSFQLQPLVDDHEMLGVGETAPENHGVHGTTGQDLYFDGDMLRGTLKIFSRSLADKIKSGTKELSLGYRCKYVKAPGVYKGQAYDYVQTAMNGNHVALVKEGRAGPEVAVLDHMVFTVDAKEAPPMPVDLGKFKEALQAMLTMLSEPEAPETADTEGVTPPSEKAPEPAAAKQPLADTEGTAPVEPAEDEEAAPAAEQSPTTDAAIAGLRAQNAALAQQLAAIQGQARNAMDEKSFYAAQADRNALAEKLSRHIGTFDHSRMTAQDVAAYGVKKLEIQCAAGMERVALDGYLQGATVPKAIPAVAMDGAKSTLASKIATYTKGA